MTQFIVHCQVFGLRISKLYPSAVKKSHHLTYLKYIRSKVYLSSTENGVMADDGLEVIGRNFEIKNL